MEEYTASDTPKVSTPINPNSPFGINRKNRRLLEGTRGLEMRHIPRVMDSVFHDVMTEEGHAMAKELASSGLIFNFKNFKRICDKKAKSIYQEILTGDISVANLPQGE